MDAGIDAAVDGMSGPCWPVDGTTPRGSIALGTGVPFVTMPDEVKVEFGPQNGFDIPVSAQIRSLVPGNPQDILDPTNPRTRFRGFFVDTGEPLNPGMCPMRLAYAPTADPQVFELSRPAAVLFEVGLPENQIFGRQVRVVLEIIDMTGSYASIEKIVTCRMPDNWPPPM